MVLSIIFRQVIISIFLVFFAQTGEGRVHGASIAQWPNVIIGSNGNDKLLAG